MTKGNVKKLALAVGMALSGISLTASAQFLPERFMQVAQDNLGQALIFPYYTVRGGWMTLFGVTNTSDQIVAVKVRFRESYNSRDVLDFNVILSPHDVWTGWVADTASGPAIFTEDHSCTIGAITSSGVPFPNAASYVGAAADGGPTYGRPDARRLCGNDHDGIGGSLDHDDPAHNRPGPWRDP